MANITQTLANTAGFIPQAWASEALDVLRQNIAVTKKVARDVDFSTGGFKGKSLTIPYPGTFTAQSKTAGSLATVQAPSNGNSVTVTLSSHQTVDFILEDVPYSEATAGVSLMQAYGQAAGIALAEKVETDLVAALATGSANVTGTPGTSLLKSTFFAARKALNDAKTPMSDRSFVISTSDAASLYNDPNMQSYLAYNPNARNDIQDGVMSQLAGFDVFESQFIGSNVAGNAVQTVTIVGTGGTFTLTYGGQTTAALPYNASATAVANALNGLSSLGAGYAAVSSASGGTNTTVYTVYLIPTLVTSPTAITGSGASLTGTGAGLTVGSSAYNTNLAFHKNALIVAFRRLQTPTAAGVEVAYAEDPMSGISLRIQMQVQPQYRGVYVAYDILYGYANLRTSQGVVVVS